jgi:UDP-N-acetyl-D-glucosamine dehydrogenase
VTSSFAALQAKIGSGCPRVCVVGLGYVGLSLASGAAAHGMTVHGVDLDARRVASLARGDNVVPGVVDELFMEAYQSGHLHTGTSFAVVREADIVVICVPTPVADHRPDLTFIESAVRAVTPYLRRGTLVILESTTYPGTTEQVVQPLLEETGLKAGADFLLAYSPERIDPGNLKYGLRNTPRIVGGISELATQLAAAFYRHLVDAVSELSSCRAAEMAKLLENTFRMVNIALINELATLCSDQNIDVWEVIDAAASKPFGFMPFYPGPGVGGHCIPLDPTYLAWQSRRDTGRSFRLVETAQDINAAMPAYVTSRVLEALNDAGLPARGSRILALGVTYKADVGDLRESAAIEILVRLARKGSLLSFHDPFIEEIHHQGLDLAREAMDQAALQAADAVILLTPHTSYDLDFIADNARLVFDARNAFGRARPATVVTL